MHQHLCFVFVTYFQFVSDVAVTALITLDQPSHSNPPCSSAQCAHIQCDEDKNYYYVGGSDGLGSQFFRRLTVKAYCANPQHRCVYVHQPMVGVEHNYRGDPNFAEFAEQLLNIQHSSPLISEMAPSCRLVEKSNIMPNRAFFTQDVLTDFRAGYRSHLVNPAERLTSASDFNCVTYLRRGDMGPPTRGRLTNQEAIDIMTKVNASYPKCTFYLISQGEWKHGPPRINIKSDYSAWLDADKKDLMRPASQTFADISQHDPGVKLVLDADVWAVFDAMATADVLVIDASTFPILAAMFNPNVVIYNAIEKSRLAYPYTTYSLDHWKLV